MEQIAIAPLDALETALNGLITSLTTSQSFANAPDFTKDLLTADDELTAALATLKRHQANYARILSLRAEVSRLQEEIRNIVRTCGTLREEIGDISAGIVDYSDSGDELEPEHPSDVDYRTIIEFATRIGKHNAAAAREAEEESIRRKVTTKRQEHDSTLAMNGGPVLGEQNGNSQLVEIPEESQYELRLLDSAVAADRASQGMAFPDSQILRLGALGQLQLIRESEGEEGVEKYMESLMRSAEQGDVQAVEEAIKPAGQPANLPSQPATSTLKRPAPPTNQPPAAVAKKVNLEMWDEDDSE